MIIQKLNSRLGDRDTAQALVDAGLTTPRKIKTASDETILAVFDNLDEAGQKAALTLIRETWPVPD